MTFNKTHIDQFNRDGFLIVRNFATEELCKKILSRIDSDLSPPLGPLEFETDVQYPGSPQDRSSPGGETPRRLLHAYTRDRVFREWALSKALTKIVGQLLNNNKIALSQNHHNCIMTKHPGFSSSTSWHQDIRYWTFDLPELVTVWLALGDEYPENGGMHFIPGTHQLELDRGRYDADYFLRHDIEENQALINSAQAAELKMGDVLFFHCQTFHAAGRNQTEMVKRSVVFTYHSQENQPIQGTRSALYPEILIT